MSTKIVEEILHFKKEKKNMTDGDRKIAYQYLLEKVNTLKLKDKFVKIINNINNL